MTLYEVDVMTPGPRCACGGWAEYRRHGIAYCREHAPDRLGVAKLPFGEVARKAVVIVWARDEVDAIDIVKVGGYEPTGVEPKPYVRDASQAVEGWR